MVNLLTQVLLVKLDNRFCLQLGMKLSGRQNYIMYQLHIKMYQ